MENVCTKNQRNYYFTTKKKFHYHSPCEAENVRVVMFPESLVRVSFVAEPLTEIHRGRL